MIIQNNFDINWALGNKKTWLTSKMRRKRIDWSKNISISFNMNVFEL